ncbi:MAG: DUF4330 domain-containing protein [Clostridiales bacterium]|jgi:hypothetical protein|nr:DUF4330 domain-containing protein [Clostridiales bacterium]
MIDKQGRLLGKVSVVDLFAVAVISAVIAVVYFNFGASGRHVVSAGQTVEITFYNPALHDFTVNAIEIDAPVIDDVNGTFLGRVVDVDIGESVNFMPDVNGIEVASPMDGYSSVYITSRVNAGISDGAVVLGGNVYGVGSEVIIWAGRAKTMLLISNVEVISQ